MKQPSQCFVDANVIMYSVGASHPLREPCRRVMKGIKEGKIRAVTNTEVLQEILYRYFSIGKPMIAESAYGAVIQLCEMVFPITLEETNKALDLLKRYPDISSRDAVHAATMINRHVKEIISTDSHFDMVSGIKRIDPREIN